MDQKQQNNKQKQGMTNPTIPQAATILNASKKERAKVKKMDDCGNEGLNDSTQCTI